MSKGSRRFREIFKNITVDNGFELVDGRPFEQFVEGIVQGPERQIDCGHSYSAWQRE